jgi:hypothetical protein
MYGCFPLRFPSIRLIHPSYGYLFRFSVSNPCTGALRSPQLDPLQFSHFRSPPSSFKLTFFARYLQHPTQILTPTAATMGNAVSKFVEKAIQCVKDFVSKAVENVKETVNEAARGACGPVVQYVVQHPLRTLGHVGSLALAVVPGVAIGPILNVVGFGTGGIVAGNSLLCVRFRTKKADPHDLGSVAASVQSITGPISADGVFATLQSAAVCILLNYQWEITCLKTQMGGAGLTTVSNVVTGAAAVAAVAADVAD